MATVVADEPCDQHYDEGEEPAGFKSHDGEEEDESADHAVYDAEDGHGT